MRFKLPTLIVLVQLKDDCIYSFAEAAELGFPKRYKQHRATLYSLALNHSFNGYRPRPNEPHAKYRNRLIMEYGTLGPLIHASNKQGYNNVPSPAYSGCIYKLAVGDQALYFTLITLCALLLEPYQPNLVLQKANVSPQQLKMIQGLLDSLANDLSLSVDWGPVDWRKNIPVNAFYEAIQWATSRKPALPKTDPPYSLTHAFLCRLHPVHFMVHFKNSPKSGKAQEEKRHVEASSLFVPSPAQSPRVPNSPPLPASNRRPRRTWAWLAASAVLFLLLVGGLVKKLPTSKEKDFSLQADGLVRPVYIELDPAGRKAPGQFEECLSNEPLALIQENPKLSLIPDP